MEGLAVTMASPAMAWEGARIADLSAALGGPGVSGLVSVVIPTYNRRRLLEEALASALCQTYPEVEVVVLDDGSTDGTSEALGGGDPRVHYWRQENAGVQAARNAAFPRCHGEFIALLDSDDAWRPWKIEAQVRLLRAFPDVGMVWTDMAAIDPAGNILHDRYLRRMYAAHDQVHIEEVLSRQVRLGELWAEAPQGADGTCYVGDVFPHMIFGNLVHTSTVLMRRSRLAATGGFDESLRVAGGDYEFHFRCTSHGPVAMLDVPSTLYRVGAADARTAPQNDAQIARNNLTTLRRYLDAFPERFALPSARRRALMASALAWLGEAELRGGLPGRGRKPLRDGLRQRLFQPRVWLLLVASLLPSATLRGARAVRRWLRRSRS